MRRRLALGLAVVGSVALGQVAPASGFDKIDAHLWQVER